MEKTIYDLKIHEELDFDSLTKIFRVPGGWIYKFYKREQESKNDYTDYRFLKLISSTFVPYIIESRNVK